MALVADVRADVMKERGVLEPLPFAIGQAVHGPRLLEDGQRQARYLVRVVGPVVAALGELDDASAADVGVAVGLCDLLAVPRDVVEDEALAQRQIAERDVRRLETPDDGVEQHGARHGEVGAARLEAGNAQPLLEAEADQLLLGRGAAAWPTRADCGAGRRSGVRRPPSRSRRG